MDEKIQDFMFALSIGAMILTLGLLLMGERWAQWLIVGGFIFVPIETFYLTPRRNKRLAWYRASNWRGGE